MVDNKFLVIGLGSMGKRRVRNLLGLGYRNIYGFDIREDRRREAESRYQIKTFERLEDVVWEGLTAVFVSVPPDKHVFYAELAYKNSSHCFIEASVIVDGLLSLSEKVRKTNLKFFASQTLRYHPTIKKIKKLVEENEIGRISNFSYHSGQYLLDWHPWENIKDFYVSAKATGGCREIVPFELGWLSWIFGDIEKICGYNDKTIDLETDIDDVYACTVKYKCGALGVLLVDVVSRESIRNLIINGEKGQLLWNWNEKTLKYYNAFEKTWTYFYEPKGKSELGYNDNIIEEMYAEEVETFLNSIYNNTIVDNSLDDDIKILGYLYALEKSNTGD